ncbi:MAG: S-adenosylmethionine decarboxylase [Deltaproteobacteria bacterium]
MNHAFGTWAIGDHEPALDALRARFGDGVTWRWTPQGLSATYFASASTIVVHTWPERSVATIDVWADDADERLTAVAAALGWSALERGAHTRHPNLRSSA